MNQACIYSSNLEIVLAVFKSVEALVHLLLHYVDAVICLLSQSVNLLSQSLDGSKDILLVLNSANVGDALRLNTQRVKCAGDDIRLGEGVHYEGAKWQRENGTGEGKACERRAKEILVGNFGWNLVGGLGWNLVGGLGCQEMGERMEERNGKARLELMQGRLPRSRADCNEGHVTLRER